MATEKITIRIEKNNFNKGALDFQIFNPETDEYDKVNAFSDENQLLKFTSETRDLADYADDFIRVLLATYRRMAGIQVEFFGSLSDYDVLRIALSNRTSDLKYVINPHCDNDPSKFKECLNSCLCVINNLLDSSDFKKQICEFETATGIKIDLPKISLINEASDEKKLILDASDRLADIDKLIDSIKRISSIIDDKLNFYGVNLFDHESDIRIFSNGLKNDFIESFAEIFSDSNIESVFNSAKNSVKASYNDFSRLSDIELRDTTKKICASVYEAVKDALIQHLKKLMNDFWKDAYEHTINQISILYKYSESIDKNPKIPTMDKLGELCDQYLKNRFLNSYDSGEIKRFGNPRKEGVEERYIKPNYIFDINVSLFIDRNFSYGCNEEDIRLLIFKYLESLSASFEESVCNEMSRFVDNVNKELRDKRLLCLKQSISLSNVLEVIQKQKQNIDCLTSNAQKGG